MHYTYGNNSFDVTFLAVILLRCARSVHENRSRATRYLTQLKRATKRLFFKKIYYRYTWVHYEI